MVAEAKYILMNKHKSVLEFSYDLDTHSVLKIADIYDLRYAPPGILDFKGTVTRRTLNDWWRARAIPASRDQIQNLLENTGVQSTLELAEKNFGLSLSDRYWINDTQNPQNWDDINFFDNDFSDDLGLMTLGQSYSEDPSLMSPNSTLGGDLQKKWKIINGERVLLKTGSGVVKQEVWNEVIATRLHQRLLQPQDYVPYSLYREGKATFVACPNMLAEDEELVSVWDLIRHKKKPNTQNDYQFLVSIYKELGLNDIEESLAKMFTCDYILANQDRHYNNFGVIRNVETLEYTHIAPIFDSGTCLWCRTEYLHDPIDFEYIAKPFGRDGQKPEKQLKLFDQYGWFDRKFLQGFTEEAVSVLQSNGNLAPKRIDAISSQLERNIEYTCSHAESQRKAHCTPAGEWEQEKPSKDKTIGRKTLEDKEVTAREDANDRVHDTELANREKRSER